MISLFEITWGAPGNSVWMVLLLPLLVLMIYRAYKKQKVAQLLIHKNASLLLENRSSIKESIKVICMSIGLICLFIALLRPQWNKSQEMVMHEGRDVYIALDISRSMLAADCAPSRLVYAKEKIKKLLSKLSCDRVGLILFSGTAFVQCPLTADYSAFYLYLDAVDAELISSGTTALDSAIQQALTSFAATPDRKNKLLIIVTDGEDFSPHLSDIKQKAIEDHLSIFTVGVGTSQGAPIPLFDAMGVNIGHQKDAKGNVVISRLNEQMLQALSQDAGGQYVRAVDNGEDIDHLVHMVSLFEKEQLGEQKVFRADDQYHYFLLISFICFLIEWLL